MKLSRPSNVMEWCVIHYNYGDISVVWFETESEAVENARTCASDDAFVVHLVLHGVRA